jgi:hypothetical protein
MFFQRCSINFRIIRVNNSAQIVTEEPKGYLGPDGNRTDSVKAQGSLTARRTCRADAKAELSEPTVLV